MVSAQTASESVIRKIAPMSFPGKGVTRDRDGKWNKETKPQVSCFLPCVGSSDRRDRETGAGRGELRGI